MLLSWKSCMCAAPKYENALCMVYPIMLQCLKQCLKYFTHKNKYWNNWAHTLYVTIQLMTDMQMLVYFLRKSETKEETYDRHMYQ